MSSVENAPKDILESVESKAARKRNVRFDDTAERYSIRKPVQVLNFAKGLTASLPEYFSERDIGDASTLKAEVSVDTRFRKKFSHNTDLCIVFSREDLPLFSHYPGIHANVEELRTQPNLKILPIEVKLRRDFSDYIEKTIEGVKNVYTKEDENPDITQLKDGFAKNASRVLNQFGTESIELSKKVAFRDLIRLYVAIDNADPETILGYYQSYQERLTELDNNFEKEEEKARLFNKDFPYLNLYDQTLSELQNTVNEKQRDAWKQFLGNIKQHYPKQLTQKASGSVVKDIDMKEGITERTAFLTTLVEVPDEMKDSGEKPKKISSTPFWPVQPTQTAEKTVAERLAELTQM